VPVSKPPLPTVVVKVVEIPWFVVLVATPVALPLVEIVVVNVPASLEPFTGTVAVYVPV